MRLVAGRNFTAEELANKQPVLVITKTWPDFA